MSYKEDIQKCFKENSYVVIKDVVDKTTVNLLYSYTMKKINRNFYKLKNNPELYSDRVKEILKDFVDETSEDLFESLEEASQYVLSPDNTFTDGLRQRPLGKKKIENILIDVDNDSLQENVKRNYQRNKTLIDLTKIPQELENEILDKFRCAPFGDRSKLLNYFIKSRLKNLTETIGEF